MNHRIWHISNCSLFEHLDRENIKQLEIVSRVKKFQRSSPIYLPGTPNEFVYLLVDGRIRIGTYTAEGKQAVIAWIEPGEIFGELSLIDEGPVEEQAEAMINSTIVQFPAIVIRDLMAKLPQLANGLTKLTGAPYTRVSRVLWKETRVGGDASNQAISPGTSVHHWHHQRVRDACTGRNAIGWFGQNLPPTVDHHEYRQVGGHDERQRPNYRRTQQKRDAIQSIPYPENCGFVIASF
jgi:hypothetical protein